jgi:hypothetical protein
MTAPTTTPAFTRRIYLAFYPRGAGSFSGVPQLTIIHIPRHHPHVLVTIAGDRRWSFLRIDLSETSLGDFTMFRFT